MKSHYKEFAQIAVELAEKGQVRFSIMGVSGVVYPNGGGQFKIEMSENDIDVLTIVKLIVEAANYLNNLADNAMPDFLDTVEVTDVAFSYIVYKFAEAALKTHGEMKTPSLLN